MLSSALISWSHNSFRLMAAECSWSQSVVASCEGIWVVCVRGCFPNSWTRAASPFTEATFNCLAKGPDEADDGEQEDEDDEEDGGIAESLHSTCLSSTLPVVGMGAAVAPEVTVISAAVVMVTVTVPPSFLVLADAWQ